MLNVLKRSVMQAGSCTFCTRDNKDSVITEISGTTISARLCNSCLHELLEYLLRGEKYNVRKILKDG